MIRCISFLLTSASSKIRATREKYTAGRRRRRQRYSWRGSVSERKPRSSRTGVMGMQQVSGRSDCSSVLLGEQIRKCHLNGSIGMKGSSREWVRWRAHCCKSRSGEAARETDRLGVKEPGVSLCGLAGLLSATSFAGLWFRGVFPARFAGLRLRGVFPAFPENYEREMRQEGLLLQGGYILGCGPREVLPIQGSLSKETRGCFGRVFFPHEGAIRHTPLEWMGTRDGGVGMMFGGGEGSRVGVTSNALMLFRGRHGRGWCGRLGYSEGREVLVLGWPGFSEWAGNW
jgi:hypothetical protein